MVRATIPPLSVSTIILGAGSVGWAVTHKAAQFPDDFGVITLASRTLSKCERIAESVLARKGVRVETAATSNAREHWKPFC